MEGNCTGNLIQPFIAPPEVTQGHHGSPVVTEGQTSKIFNIFQMTYQMEGNFTGNLMQPFLTSKSGVNWPVGPVHQNQTGP